MGAFLPQHTIQRKCNSEKENKIMPVGSIFLDENTVFLEMKERI
jgi:hypothetical protein